MRVENLWVRSLRPHIPPRTSLRNTLTKNTLFKFVDVVKDIRMSKNGVEFLIGCRDFPNIKYDTSDPITNWPGSEHMIVEFNIHWEDSLKNTRSKWQRNFNKWFTRVTKFLTDSHCDSCDNKHFPTSWKHEGHGSDNGFLTTEFKFVSSGIQDTQVDVLHQDVSVHQPSGLGDHVGDSTSMDVNVDLRW